MLKIKRIYSAADKTDGFRILVDRLWPRGISKEKAALDMWEKDIAPSEELRKNFGHVPEKFAAFKDSYIKEIGSNPAIKEFLHLVKAQLGKGDVTLVYGAKDELNNQAVVLRDYVLKHISGNDK